MTNQVAIDDRRPVLLERSAELRALADLARDLRPGAGRVALVEGPPGIGKTSLIDAFKVLVAEQDLRMVTARGTELARDVSFGVIADLFGAAASAALALSAVDEARVEVPRTGDFALLQRLFDAVLG